MTSVRPSTYVLSKHNVHLYDSNLRTTNIKPMERTIKSCDKKRIANCAQRVFAYRYVITPWLTVLDVISDIMALVQYWSNAEIPNFIFWIALVVLYFSFRFQMIVFVYFTVHSLLAGRDGGPGGLEIGEALIAYIPLIAGVMAVATGELSLCSWILFEPLLVIASVIAPLIIFVATIYIWIPWMRHLFCCGPEPKTFYENYVSDSGSRRNILNATGAAMLLADWETIFESFPQSIIGSVVYVMYLESSSDFDTAVIGLSVIISLVKLIYTVFNICKNNGHNFF